MNLLQRLGLSKMSPKSAIVLLQRLSKRSEDLTPEEQAKSFVSIRNIEGTLLNRDSRIVYGRRGTGKTHIMSFVAKSAQDRGEVPIIIDLRTIGSNNTIYSDEAKPAHVRATHLIRDFLSAIHDRMLDRFTEPNSSFVGYGLDAAIAELATSVRSVLVEQTIESRELRANTDSLSGEANAEVSVDIIKADFSIKTGAAAKAASENERQVEVTTKGTPKLTVNMGNAYKSMADVAESSRSRIWILLDEWSSIPETLQPYLADFIRRAVLPVSKITVQIAAIEFRSRFREDFGKNRVGFELGSDISADINLDDYFVYDNSPNIATEFFRELLFRHLQALSLAGEFGEKTAKELTNAVFSQERVFQELVRASEGVPRDFINILQLAAMRTNSNGGLTMNEVRVAAKDWFERDKQRNIDTNDRALALLEWIRDSVITKKKARAFLAPSNDNDESMQFLFDERLLHIARRSYSAKDNPGVRYRVWKVDYGCYVDLINTVQSPTGFLFEGYELNQTGEIEVPEDDLRAVRRAILDIEKFAESYASKA
ncbi:hypothetical protein [Rhizobium leguminosarum]|uniref:hypothetical protein n=1 Tax=Rhizobium leguminosarum TaxID=384 RepID=UPI003F95E552